MSRWLEHPDWWPALAIACGLILLALGLATRRARIRRASLLDVQGGSGARTVARDALLIVALVALAVGLIGPRIGRARIAPVSGGVDVVLLFDLSQSMDADDTAPSRLRRSIDHATALLGRLAAGDRIALAGFAGRGVLFTPLTPDRDAIASMLPHLDTRLLRPGGSDLAAGIEACLPAFDAASTRPRIVVVWSDGEISDPVGEVGDAAAARADVRVLALGMGSESGSEVPDHGAPLRDASGVPVVTRRFLGTLERLADATGGIVQSADRFGQIDVDLLAAQVDRDTLSPNALAAAPGQAAQPLPAPRSVPVAVAWPFAGLAFMALLVESGLAARAPRRPRRKRERVRPRALARAFPPSGLAVAAALAFALRAAAGDASDSRRIEAWLERGVARALAGDVDGAAADFEAASLLALDSSLVALAEYDLGVLAVGHDDLESARDHFLASLSYVPDDPRARFNAEWTLRALAARVDSDEQPAAARPEPAPPHVNPADRSTREPAKSDAIADAGAAASVPVAKDPDPGPARMATDREASSGELPIAGMSDAERARWLEQVGDDPSRAMQIGAAADRSKARIEPGAMTW